MRRGGGERTAAIRECGSNRTFFTQEKCSFALCEKGGSKFGIIREGDTGTADLTTFRLSSGHI